MASRNQTKKPVEPPADPLSPFLGPLFLRARKDADLKQEVVAEKAGLSDATLRKIETGVGPTHNDAIESICGALNLDQDLILLEAADGLRFFLLSRLRRDPKLPIHSLEERRRGALKARHEAEVEELEAQLTLESLLYLHGKNS